MADDAAAPSGELGEAEQGADDPEVGPGPDSSVAPPPRFSHVQVATIAGLVAVVALGGLSGWLGYQAIQSRALDHQRQTFLQVGRQGAVNLTTLDFEHIDADVQRILDSATGTFYDDFQQRSPAFVAVVKQVRSKSVGTVVSAAIESDTPTEAEILVAVNVKSAIVGQPDQPARPWRMRIQVQKVVDDTKVSNVEFVP